ncbi:MAG: YhbY family RNA-binding protein, partial [Tissierellia bacterium]|nr:YhbY family RNA-binding protein [Tissierellia bacterium]
MITGKQRAYLKGLAQTKKASLQFGKNGLTETFISQVET